MPKPLDPDAALHGAQPGKFKPGAVDQGVAPPPASSGTLADTVTAMPDLRPVVPTAAPIEDPASLSDVFHASSREAQRDASFAEERRLVKGWAPITQALGLDPSENPGSFEQLDEQSAAHLGNAGSRISRLATDAGAGVSIPFTNNRMADRNLQERLAVALIVKRRQTQPNFLPGVPDTVEGIHKYFLENERKASDADRATLAKSPGGIAGTAASLAGGTVGSFHDPVNIAALAVPGGEGKSLIQIAARDAMINSLLELGQQPTVASNRHELGQEYTFSEGAANVAMAGVGGAVLGPAMHVGGKAVAATGIPQAIARKGAEAYNGFADKLFTAMPERLQKKWGNAIVKDWARRISNGERLDDVFSSLNNRELTTLTRTLTEGRLTPDESAAANVLERSQDVAESSPYAGGPTGEGTHTATLDETIKSLIDNRPPQEVNSPAATARPPATSTAERPQAGDVEGSIASFKAKVGGVENATGDIHAKNPRSSASGNAQFTDGTFRNYYHQVYGVDLGKHPPRDLKDNPEIQARLLDALTRDNAAHLQRIGEAVNEGNLYLEHFLGSGGAYDILKASPDARAAMVLPREVIEANPFLEHMSASEVIAWAHKKMGRQTASVPARSAAGELASAGGEDPMVAQLRAEALQLDDQVAGLTRAPDGSPVNLYTRSVPSSAIGVDASRFQFKSGGDQFGVTERLKGVKEWDAGLAGRVTLWEDEGGKLWLADGHQRHGLARRISADTGKDIPLDAMILRSSDGISAEDARVWAALKNIAEGTGSPVDAAKVLRDGGEHLLDRLPPKSALVRDGAALSRLSDDAFGAVYNERIPADQAAVIGHLLPNDPDKHAAMVDLLIKADPANRSQAQSIVRQAIAAGFDTAEQIDLFGKSEASVSLLADKAKIQERALAKLRKMRLVHNTAAKEAGTLEKAGSKIAVERSQREAQANAEAIAIVDRLAYRAGPVADALGDAARELRDGGRIGEVVDRYAARIRELDLAALDREGGRDVGGGANLDGNGREGDAREEGASLFEEQGDQGQPSLADLERATERFSDPDGPAVKQQAASLVHDLKADLEASQRRREQIKAATAALEGVKPGEFRTIEPFPDQEPGYHRFRYVAEDGTMVGGNYTLDRGPPPFVEGFNVGDANSPVKLGAAEVRKLFAQLKAQHPDIERIHAFRMTGARANAGSGPKEIWIDLTGKSKEPGLVAPEDVEIRGGEPPEHGAPAAASEAPSEAVLHGAIASGADTRGMGAQFHGARGEVPDLTEGYYNPDNIYGGFETFYTTDSTHIAGGYRRKHADGRIYRAIEKEPVKMFDMEQPIAAEDVDRLFHNDDLAGMAYEEAAGANGGKPNLREVMDEMRALSAGEGISKDGVQEIFDTAIVNLRNEGFGGMTHIGGLRTGRDPHAVKIYFDAPNQLELRDVTPGKAPPAAAPDGNPLDLGPQVDPGKSANDRQIGALAAASPMGAPRDKPTLGEIGLELFDKANQPEMKFRLDEHGEPISAADLLKELEDDDAAIAALKGCL